MSDSHLNMPQSRRDRYFINYGISIDWNTYFNVFLSFIKHLEHVITTVNYVKQMVTLCNERLNILMSHSNPHYLWLLRLTGCVFYLINNVI